MPSARDALLAAARWVVVSGDWERMPLAELAGRAGVSRQTLYKEFGSKDGLAQALSAQETEIFLTELAPRRLRGPLTMLVDLLAAVPSVVYGLWGVYVLIPKLLPAEKWFASTFSFIPFVGGTPALYNYFVAGLVLAIMILPIVSAIARPAITLLREIGSDRSRSMNPASRSSATPAAA